MSQLMLYVNMLGVVLSLITINFGAFFIYKQKNIFYNAFLIVVNLGLLVFFLNRIYMEFGL